MNQRIFAGALLLGLFAFATVHATPFPTLSESVSVCDPNSPTHCAAPDSSGNLPITGTISASLGGFTPSASGARMTPLSVTTADSSGNLPTGAVAVISNVGTNPMYCNVNGVAATTSDELIASNSWFAFTIPAAVTTLHCIATGGTTTANGVGGAGLATGAGGGSAGGGGGGGAVFGPTAVGSAAANPPVLIAGTANAGATGTVQVAKVSATGLVSVDGSGATQPVSGTVTANAGTNLNTSALSTSAFQATNTATTAHTCSVAGFSELGCLGQLDDDIKAPLPAGTAVIGKVGIDQTTPGTTNGVQINAALPAGTNTIGAVNRVSQYPVGATAITASATGTTAATTATLAAAVGKTTYICSMSIRANATAAVTGNATVTGTITGTLNFTQWTAPAASGLGVVEEVFSPCVPGSTTNTGIAVVSAAPGTGGVVSVSASGYQL